MAFKTYTDLVVWQKSLLLSAHVYRVTTQFPNAERFGLVAQFRRAAVSIPINIAEGYGRATRGEYLNQLSVARGSAFEVEALCHVSATLQIATPESLDDVRALASEVQRMLSGLRRRVRESMVEKSKVDSR